MKRHLTEHLASLAGAPLAEFLAPGEGFEVISGGAAVRWHQRAAPAPEGDRCVWRLAQAAGALTAQAALELDPAHRAASYHVELTNSAPAPVVVEAIYPLVVRFGRLGGPWRTLTAGGGSSENFYPPRACRPRQRLVFGGEVRIESPPCGRSSNRHLPLMLAAAGQQPDGPGLFAGMEYSGEWSLALRHVGDGPFIRGALKMADVVLGGGETLALPAVHVGFFDGGLEAGTNALRRYIRDRICPRRPTPAAPERAGPPVSYNHWFGITNDFDEPFLRRQVRRAAGLGVEYWVHGPGWFEGGFPAGVGNWDRADPARYPHGLEALADFVRSAGMKFGLWFEIERAMPGTWAAERSPQLFFAPQPHWAGRAFHLNLSRPDAADWAIETVSRWIERLGLEWIRFDYNIEPAPYLSAADPTGKIQLAYYAGLCRVLDTLMQRHGGLRIETCSGGGRRIDLATLRRTHSGWLSDQTHNPDICRYVQCRFARLAPGGLAGSAVTVSRGAGGEGFGERDVLSRMCGALCFSGDVASWPAALARRMRKWTDRYKRIRHLLDADFHQLLPTPTTDRDWDAVQFIDEQGTESVVFAFRMAGDVERLNLPLRRIDPQATYLVQDMATTRRGRKTTGAELVRRGLTVRLSPHSAKCIHTAAVR